MAQEGKPRDPSDPGIDAAWRADPLSAPPPKPAAPPPPARKAEAPPPPPEPAAAEPAPEAAPAAAEPAAEPQAPPPSSTSPFTLVILAAVVIGLGAAWHLTAPARAFNRGLGLLYKAQRTGDARTAEAALGVFKGYVDRTGTGWDRLFAAAALAGDEETGAAYEARLMKKAPESGSALLVWYEGALSYHLFFARAEVAALDSAATAEERKPLVEKIAAHRDAAAALKPTRAKAVDAFDNGFPAADAARLLSIDAMHRELDELDPAKLAAPPERKAAPAVEASSAAAAGVSASSGAAVSVSTAAR